MTKAQEAALKAFPGESLIHDRTVFRFGYEQAEKNLGWISVKDRLPMQDEEVIVLTDKLGIAPMYEISFGHIVDKERCIDYDGWNVPGVEYWMFCPEIPED